MNNELGSVKQASFLSVDGGNWPIVNAPDRYWFCRIPDIWCSRIGAWYPVWPDTGYLVWPDARYLLWPDARYLVWPDTRYPVWPDTGYPDICYYIAGGEEYLWGVGGTMEIPNIQASCEVWLFDLFYPSCRSDGPQWPNDRDHSDSRGLLRAGHQPGLGLHHLPHQVSPPAATCWSERR